MLVLVTALRGESRPLIKHFNLRRRNDTTLPVYASASLLLVQSGIGRTRAAAAVDMVQGLLGSVKAAWLNVGIAGSGTGTVGEIVLAHKIIEAATGSSWYPHLSFDPPCRTATLLTVDRPETDYPPDVVVEMEAAGVHAAACKFSSGELVHSLKIISDTRQTPISSINRALVENLLHQNLPVISELTGSLSPLADEFTRRHALPQAYQACLARWHFTATQRHQLSRLLRRWAVLGGSDAPDPEKLTANDGRSALQEIEKRIATFKIHLTNS